jgi:putative Ca2+/H+ antiporter (TMEM165/GDT1 family)
MLPPDTISISLSTFTLVALAEIGDKSQLVCMTLAARHRHWPVLAGVAVAFFLLNTLAVIFGAAAALLIPERVIAISVALLFGFFGLHILLHRDDGDVDDVAEATGHGIFFTSLLLIFISEFGDKTQIAVAGLASSMRPLPVWIGATAALLTVSALGVWAGRTLLQRLPMQWLNYFSGSLFLIFALLALFRAFQPV